MAAIEVSSNSFQNIILLIIVFLCIAYLYYEIMKIKSQYSFIENNIYELNTRLDTFIKENKENKEDKENIEVSEEKKNVIYYDSEYKHNSENNDITKNEYKILDKMNETNKSNPNIKEVVYSNYENKDTLNDEKSDISNDEEQYINNYEKIDDNLNNTLHKESEESIHNRIKDFDDFEQNMSDPIDVFKTDFLNTEENIIESDKNQETIKDSEESNEDVEDDKSSEDSESSVDYENMTVKELREVLLILNLPVSGNKETLINRIKNKQ
tara:strand:- start:136 stop:939 length:804 start_codon:yes stop_codon:yes gene_type:complete